MFDWVKDNPAIVWWLGITSAVMFVGTLVVLPFLVVRIPADYFVRERRPESQFSEHHPIVRVVLMIAKNTLGVIFLAAGVAMLLLPGQGLITMVIGVLLIDFPGKFRVERWLVRRPLVAKTINWMREKSHHPPLEIPRRE